jgi:hypothetical protein
MKKKIYDIVFAAQYEGLDTKEATSKLLGLFSVVGQSEQLPCDCEKHRVKSNVQDFCGNCGTTLI